MINQNYNSPSTTELPVNIGTIMLLVVRVFIILVGLGITLFGINYTVEIFMTIYNYLQTPETLTPVIEKWAVLLNIKGLIIADYPLDKLLALVILAIGALLLLRITLGFIHVGTTVLINSATIVNAVNSNNAKEIINLDSKLLKLKSMADQGIISKQAYEAARDKYLVQKIIGD